jgi:3-oxoadipate enol-lactonase
VFAGSAPRIALSVAGSGPLVLFLHGIGGNRRHWNRQVEFFSTSFRAAAWDTRGYGDSDDYEGPLEFSQFSLDLLKVLDLFGESKAHLVGLSMGGRIARNFALDHPDKVRSLVLANTTPGFDALAPEQVKAFVDERKTRTPESLRRLLGSRAGPDAYQHLLESFHAMRQPSYLKTLEASVSQDRAAPVERIQAPTLVITGEEDRVYPPAIARDMARRIPRAELVELEGCGHLSNLEQPERFNQLVLQFLIRQEGRK